MFKLSRRADYATRILLELAVAENQKLTAQEAAKRCGIRLPFLRKAVADLVAAGLLGTQPGPRGGMTLTRSPSQISMLQVVEAIEGSVCLNACLLRPGECPRDRICPAHTFWGRLQLLVISELNRATLDVLAREYLTLQQNPRPQWQLLSRDSLVATPSSQFEPGSHPQS